MARSFDVTTKHLFEHHPGDWLVYAGLEPGPAELLNVDLSTLTASADHVLRVGREAPWLAHFEFQTGRDLALARRLQLYNVLLNHRHDLPVQTVVVLLRRSADGPELTGLFRQSLPGGRVYHEFHHRIIRVWEKPVEEILSGGLGTLPLAPLADVAREDLPQVIRRMESRLAAEAPVEDVGLFWTAVYILSGLRYEREFLKTLLRGVQSMKESVTYQAILEEGEARGEARGEAKGERRLILNLGARRFGPPSSQVTAAIEAINDPDRLERLGLKLLEVASWEELLADD